MNLIEKVTSNLSQPTATANNQLEEFFQLYNINVEEYLKHKKNTYADKLPMLATYLAPQQHEVIRQDQAHVYLLMLFDLLVQLAKGNAETFGINNNEKLKALYLDRASLMELQRQLREYYFKGSSVYQQIYTLEQINIEKHMAMLAAEIRKLTDEDAVPAPKEPMEKEVQVEEFKTVPSGRIFIAPAVFEEVVEGLMPYVQQRQHVKLKELLQGGASEERINFRGQQNVLADLFRRLYAQNYLRGTLSKTGVAKWLAAYFNFYKEAPASEGFVKVSYEKAYDVLSKGKNLPAKEKSLCIGGMILY